MKRFVDSARRRMDSDYRNILLPSLGLEPGDIAVVTWSATPPATGHMKSVVVVCPTPAPQAPWSVRVCLAMRRDERNGKEADPHVEVNACKSLFKRMGPRNLEESFYDVFDASNIQKLFDDEKRSGETLEAFARRAFEDAKREVCSKHSELSARCDILWTAWKNGCRSFGKHEETLTSARAQNTRNEPENVKEERR